MIYIHYSIWFQLSCGKSVNPFPFGPDSKFRLWRTPLAITVFRFEKKSFSTTACRNQSNYSNELNLVSFFCQTILLYHRMFQNVIKET